MKIPLLKKFVLTAALFAGALGFNNTQAATTTFTGSYSQNFDLALTNGATALPPGFVCMQISSSYNFTSTAPVTTTAIAAATAQTQTAIIWNAGAAVAKSGTQLYNIGCWDNTNADRALGSDATGVGAVVIQLAMTNKTGGTLYGVTFSYDCKCMTNGGAKSGYPSTDLTEDQELPGYCFFYSTTGTNSAANWTEVGLAGNTVGSTNSSGVPIANGLTLPNFTQGTTMSSGPVNITFATPLTNNGVMYFRWADDDCTYISADQMVAIDNISIATYNPAGPTVGISSPANNAAFIPGSNITNMATASDSGGTITNVEFYANGADLGGVTSAPYSLTWSNVSIGSYALTAVAADSGGILATSAVVNITVAHLTPTVAITSPASGAAYATPASIALTATASDTDGNVTNVAFYSGATLLANVASTPYNYTWPNVPAGSYLLTAVASVDTGASNTSSAVSVTVTNLPNPLVASFTGSYTQNFDLDLTNSTTTMPAGFQAMGLAGDHFLYTNGVPITTNAIATNVVAGTAALTVWNAGAAVARAQAALFNIGCWDSPNDRALGSSPTGNAGTVVQLALTNNTGGSLLGVVFSYTEKCLTNGTTSNGSYTDDGTERLELPGYSFFYSLTGDTNPTNWFRVDALCLTNWVQGTSSDSGPVTIPFATPLPTNGVMYFRWADDNCVASSPDQMFAIDNISVNSAGTALQFDGVNDYVTFGPATTSLGVSNYTVECWFKRTGTGATTSTGTGGVTAYPLVTKGRGEADGSNLDCNWFLGFNASGQLAADFEDFNSGLNHPLTGVTPIASNVWQHAAVTYDVASGTCVLYLNGVPDATNVVSGSALVRTPRYDSIQHAGLATALTSTGVAGGFFNGVIDEARVWNYARSAQQIAASYQLELTNNPAGLIARWALNEGFGTVCSNSVPGGVNGTLTNGPVWVSGYPFGTFINQSPTVSITNPLVNAAFTEGTNVTIQVSANDADGSVTNVAFLVDNIKIGDVASAPFSFVWTNAVFGDHVLTAVATDNLGAATTSAAIGITVTPAPGVGGLYFDGVNDYVTFGPAPGLGVSNFTAECWFKRQGTGVGTTTGTGGITAIPLVSKGRAESDGSDVDCNYFLGINGANNALAADFEDFNSGLNHPIVGVTPVANNVWQHAAVTYDSTTGTWVLYLNGVPDATNVISGSGLVLLPRYDSIQHAGLATAMNSTGVAAGFFNGTLDEVRIWNYARSADQIAANYNRPIPAAAGLIARWALDETDGDTASNSIDGGVNGTLTNGPLRVDGYPFANAVAITSPVNGAQFDAPANITLNASAVDISGAVTNVEFFSGATSLGVSSSSPFSTVWSGVPAGNYALTAVATDDSGTTFTSAAVNISVVVPNLPATVTAVVSPTNNATAVAKSPALGVTVSDPEGATNLTVTFYGRVAAPAAAADFSVIALPDTQFYSQSYPSVFKAQTDWILTNHTALNIAYVTQLGDCVQSGDNGGDDFEWRNATNALYTLENPLTTLLANGIPYGVAVGNHDQSPNGDATGTTTFYNQYFGTNHFLPYNYYGGNYGTNGDNFYELFSAGGMDFIAVYFEYDTTLTSTNAPIFTWANHLLQTNANRRAIVVSHYIINSYTAGSTFGAQGQTIYDALKGNTNLFLMLCGHVNPNGEGRRTDVFNGGTVQTLLSDYQDLVSGGNGWLRIYTFSPSNNVIHAQTYSPWLDSYQTGTNSQFDVPYMMTPANPFSIIGTATNVPSGGNALVTWFGLATNTTYEWYATVSDGHSTSTGPVSQFTTASNFPAIPPTVTLISPTNNDVFTSPATIALAATAADADGIVTNVAFYQGAIKLADVAASPFTYNWPGVAVGNYALTAVATDDNGLMTTSSVVNVSVTNTPAVQTVQQIKTVFIIALENHDWVQKNPTGSPQQIFANPAAPYINSLVTPGNSNAVQVAYAAHYYNIAQGEHPSEPNYIWSEAGTEFGTHTDNDPSTGSGNLFSHVQHLSAQLTATGIPWRSYQEDVEYSSSSTVSASGTAKVNPYNGTTQYWYVAKHNPMAFFTDTQNKNCYPLTNFWTDLTNNNIGRYNWITPDQYNEMHSALPSGYTYHGTAYTGDQAAIAEGDNALSIIIPKIMASPAYQDHGVIIIWTDETESTDDTNTTLPFIIISPLAKGNAYASTLPYSHSSTLKTMDELFGLAFQTNAIPTASYNAFGAGSYNYVDGRSAVINDLSDMFQSLTPPVITVPGTTAVEATNAGGNVVNFTVTANDAVDGALTPSVTPASGSLFPLGTNIVIAMATDSRGMSATNTFEVIVQDTTPPVITINGANPFTNFQSVAFVDPGATAYDVVSGFVPVTNNGTVDVGTLGTYNVQYVASDVAGNSATNTRTVQVVTLPAPANLNGAAVSGGSSSGFQLSFGGAIGQPYRIIGTDDLTQPATNWTVLASGIVTNNPVTFTDAAAVSNACRYYRIVSP